MIRKILVANRGEIACRIIRTCREMGIATVAVYSDADRNALHVDLADEAIYLGGSEPSQSYLNIEKVIDASKRSGADALHPGYGFTAENADFARATIDAGIIFIGPSPETIAVMGDKRQAKTVLQNIPFVPGYYGYEQTNSVLHQAANAIGFPIMVKAALGGGGRGMRLVRTADEFRDALDAARRETSQAFGDTTIMLEKFVEDPRHIEVQIVGDRYGNVIAIGERECSIQRRYQKLIEEAPSPALSAGIRQNILETAIEIGRQIEYVNAGTIEFLLAEDGSFYFMEMNTRLQVEHPVTEMIYDIDLVRWQIMIAEGYSLSEIHPKPVQSNGHAIEARIYAEDPRNQFAPSTGEITHWQPANGVRTDSGVRTGDTISMYYDPMIAKVIVHGRDRAETTRKLHQALGNTILLGPRHNIAYLQSILQTPDFIEGDTTTNFVSKHRNLQITEQLLSPIALIAVSIAHDDGTKRWRNMSNHPISHKFTYHDREITMEIMPSKQAGNAAMAIDGEIYEVRFEGKNEQQFSIEVNGYRQTVTVLPGETTGVWWAHCADGTFCLRWQNPLAVPTADTVSTGSLNAPMPGKVTAIHVRPGQNVQPGELLMVVEAMKVEHRIEAPSAGTISEIHFDIGDIVTAKTPLLRLLD